MTLTMLNPAQAVDGTREATVKVWFAGHLVADWSGPADKACGIAAAWDQRYGVAPVVTGVEW